jgi:hypothetical protein
MTDKELREAIKARIEDNTAVDIDFLLLEPLVDQLVSLFRSYANKDTQSSEIPTQRTYTQKELYQFVTEYSREAMGERFDMSVGDFVDWIASRDTQEGYGNESTWEIAPNPKNTSCLACGRYKGHETNCAFSTQESKPVLPEKLAIHSSRNYRDPDEVLDILLETQTAVNAVIGYLSRKEQ